MRQSVRRWLFGAGAVATVGAVACVQGVAGAASAAASHAAVSAASANRVSVMASADAVSAATVVKASTPAATTPYVPPSKPLHVGQRGPAVRSVQQRLARLHYYPGPIDGVYGQNLLEAAWAFREVQGLPMNAYRAAQPITTAFEHDLINPRQPYSRHPHGPANRVEINQNIEVLVLYKNNKPSLIIHVSTGGGYHYCSPGGGCGVAITPDGRFSALSFAAGWIQVPLGTMYNPVFFIGRAYAIHGDIPAPWYPASHGCVRIWMDVAPWFHNRLSIGGAHPTVIFVYGKAPYQPSIVGS